MKEQNKPKAYVKLYTITNIHAIFIYRDNNNSKLNKNKKKTKKNLPNILKI